MQALHHPTMSSVQAMSSPSSSGSTNGSNAADSDASITANDFLTLLVAEMKNQDPTADTDPNAYIDQLVQVNSLQQLIQINQDLGGNSSTTSNSNSPSASSSGSSESSNPSSQAMSAASRLATSLTAKHPQPGSAEGSAVVQSQSAAPQAAAAFQAERHKS